MGLARLIPNAENATHTELEVAARCAPTQKAHNRLRAMIALIEGFEIRAVAKIFGVSVRTVQRWIGRFNTRGIDGLLDTPRPGRPPKIDADMTEQCRDLFKRHAEPAPGEDLPQSHEVLIGVQAVPGLAAIARYQQAQLVVVVQRAHGHAGDLRDFRNGSSD